MASYSFKPITTKSEIKELPNILSPEEKLLGLLEGMFKRIHNREINGNGLVIATNKRVIFFRKSLMGTVTKEEIPISKISSSSFRKGLLFSSVAIVTSNNEAVVEQCDKATGERFNNTVQKLISDLGADAGSQLQQSQPAPAQAGANFEQLEKLFDLKQKGILTDEEFAAQKAKLLN